MAPDWANAKNASGRGETVASIPGGLAPSADQPDAPARGSAGPARPAGDPTLAGASGWYPTGIRAPTGPQQDPGPIASLQSRSGTRKDEPIIPDPGSKTGATWPSGPSAGPPSGSTAPTGSGSGSEPPSAAGAPATPTPAARRSFTRPWIARSSLRSLSS